MVGRHNGAPFFGYTKKYSWPYFGRDPERGYGNFYNLPYLSFIPKLCEPLYRLLEHSFAHFKNFVVPKIWSSLLYRGMGTPDSSETKGSPTLPDTLTWKPQMVKQCSVPKP